MIQTTPPLSSGKHAPFSHLSSYEALLNPSIQSAHFHFQPSTSSAVLNGVPPTATAECISPVPIPKRKTLRTVIVGADGTLQSAQINMTTGEVVPWQYKDYSRSRPMGTPPWEVAKPTNPLDTKRPIYPRTAFVGTGRSYRSDLNPIIVLADHLNAVETPPFWMASSGVTSNTAQPKQPDKSRKKLFNGVKMYLEDYLTLDEAIEALPLLDDLITGASLLDLGGNTRPLNRRLLFAMLQRLELISSETVKEFTGRSIRHSQKIASCLRVIVNAFVREAEATGIR